MTTYRKLFPSLRPAFKLPLVGQTSLHKVLKDASVSNVPTTEGVLFVIIVIYNTMGHRKLCKLPLEYVRCITIKAI